MIDRRMMIRAALAAIATPAATRALAEPAVSRITAYAFSFSALTDGEIRLADYTGRPLLVVNTASPCGYTPQYAGLQELWSEFQGRGFGMIGVPSNDFGGQEPGGAREITETTQHQYAVTHLDASAAEIVESEALTLQRLRQYAVTFPIAAKSAVAGPNAHPFYRWAAEARPKDVPRWNFHKYLIGRDGYIADVFASAVEPTDTRVKTAVAKALADT